MCFQLSGFSPFIYNWTTPGEKFMFKSTWLISLIKMYECPSFIHRGAVHSSYLSKLNSVCWYGDLAQPRGADKPKAQSHRVEKNLLLHCCCVSKHSNKTHCWRHPYSDMQLLIILMWEELQLSFPLHLCRGHHCKCHSILRKCFWRARSNWQYVCCCL